MASGTIKAVVGRSDIVDNLTTNDSTKVLSAKQGKALKDAADTLNDKIAQVDSKIADTYTSAPTVDLNDLSQNGIYTFNANSSNKPSSGGGCVLVLSYSWRSQVLQLAMSANESGMYWRNALGGSWGTWHKIS